MANLAFILVVLGLYILVARRPGVACGLILASYAIEQFAQAMVPFAGANDTLCNYLTAGAVLLALGVQLVRGGVGIVRLTSPVVATGVMLAYCYATVSWSMFPSSTAAVLRVHVPYLCVFVILAPLVIQSIRDLEDCLAALIIGSTLALLGLLLFAEWGARGIVLPGKIEESNPLALTQTAGALLIAAALSEQLKRLFPHAWLIVAAVIGTTVLFIFLRSGSRGQIISALVTLLLFSIKGKNRWWLLVAFLGVVALLGTDLFSEEVARNAERWDPEKMSDNMGRGRMGVAEELVRFWASSAPSRLWWGLGHAASQDPRLLGGYPHVVPAEVLAEEGLVGFGLYLTMLSAAALAYLGASESGGTKKRDFIRVLAALAVFEFILTFKQGTLLGAPNFFFLLVVPGAFRTMQLTRLPKAMTHI